jgi:hypothetical protein
MNLQADGPPQRRPAPLEDPDGAFESHLTAAAGRRRPLPTRRVSPGVGAYPSVELVLTLPGSTNVVLVRRATTVPFTRVATGPQRTPTDSAR